MKDNHYTPSYLADHLIDFILEDEINTVADFCVGEGNLLEAAKSRWSNIKCFGTDISLKEIKKNKLNHPEWILGRCDFLNKNERSKCLVFKEKFDLILLNPPFTCKGSSVLISYLDDRIFRVSTAMAFVVNAIKYLNSDGLLYAILPQSVAYSNKDREIFQYLKDNYNLKVIEEINNQGFEHCSPNIIIISINDLKQKESIYKIKQINTNINYLQVHRGNISMHEIPTIADEKDDKVYLIHSTNLKYNQIVDLNIKINAKYCKIDGSAVLIHRVGQPNKSKIIISSGKYALSDCIIAIKTGTEQDSIFLKKLIEDNWNDFCNLYKGTGAKYITLDRLNFFLDLKG